MAVLVIIRIIQQIPTHQEFYQKLEEELEEESKLLERLGDISYLFERQYRELDAFEIERPTTYLVSEENHFVAFLYLYVMNRVLLIHLGVLKEERKKPFFFYK